MAKLPDPTAISRPTPGGGGGVVRYRPAGPDRTTQIESATASDINQAGADLAGAGSILKAGVEAQREDLQAAQIKVRSKQDAVARARAYGSFGESASAELRRLQTEADFSDPTITQQYGQFLREQMGEILEGHTGSDESRLTLMGKLEAARFGYVDQAAVQSAVAGEKLIGATVGQYTKKAAAQAYDNPGDLAQLFAEFDADLADMAPGLTPDQEHTYRVQGRSAMVQNSIEALITRQRYGDAERVMSMPGVDEVLSVQARAKVKKAIYTSRKRLRDARMKGVNDARQKIAEARELLGREPTQEERRELAGLDAPETGFEDTRKLSLDIITSGAQAYGAGLMDTESEAKFESAVTHYMQPRTRINPDTQQVEEFTPRLSWRVADALKTRGWNVAPDMVSPVFRDGRTADQPADPRLLGQPAPTPGMQGEGIDDLVPLEDVGGDGPLGGQTIWDSASLITGPVPAFAEAVGRSPVLGTVVRPEQITQARNLVPLIRRQLVTALQNSPKFNEGERQSIEKDTQIEGSVFDNPAAFRDRLIAIDLAIEFYQQQAERDMNQAELGGERRRVAANKVNAFRTFRAQLGTPPRMPADPKTQDEWLMRLDDGAAFIAPDGSVRVVDKSVFTQQGGSKGAQ